MLKTYETIGILNRHITAIIDGKEIAIHFKNGTEAPRRVQGRFTTGDPKIQEYLEKSPAFNVRWRLVGSQGEPEKKPVINQLMQHEHAPDDDLAKTHNITPKPKGGEDDVAALPDGNIMEETEEDVPQEELPQHSDGIIVVGEEVVNGQQARNYLIDRFKDITFRQLATNAQIIAEAKARNIQFTHWEVFVTSK